jgi:hypothetical protein
MAFKLPKRIINIIAQKLSTVFDEISGQLLGPTGKHLVIRYNKDLSLPGIYESANRESGGLPDLETLSTMVDSTKNYLDSLKAQAINKTVKVLEASKPEEIEQKLRESWEDVTNKLKTIVETETTAYRNIGLLEGITRVNASMNIKDPVIVFLTSRDGEVCEDCTAMHLMPDHKTPRAWYLSEINHGYFKRGDSAPSIWELHPNGRCTMITILPGFGFKKGSLAFIATDYDIIKDQRNL